MKTYIVTIPIAGHVSFEIEAETEEAAKRAAWSKDASDAEGELTWETLETFVRGNVCYCPTPWEVEVEEV
jgi:hypothetical protein